MAWAAVEWAYGMQVLSFAVKPRALWVAAHHLELTGRMDGVWSALLNAVADLVSGNEADYDSRRYTQPQTRPATAASGFAWAMYCLGLAACAR